MKIYIVMRSDSCTSESGVLKCFVDKRDARVFFDARKTGDMEALLEAIGEQSMDDVDEDTWREGSQHYWWDDSDYTHCVSIEEADLDMGFVGGNE